MRCVVGTLALLGLVLAVSAAQPYAASSLRVEHRNAYVVVDTPFPRFSWVVSHPTRGEYQRAYQILVSSDTRGEHQVWDSGKVMSNNTILIEYAGNTLMSDTDYYWTVTWWDSQNQASPASPQFKFTVGMLLGADDFRGEWIGGAYQLRTTFQVPYGASVTRAQAYLAGVGYSELYINGAKIGPNKLDPAWTNYTVRVLYSSWDVQDNLVYGENCVGVLLGNGWYSDPFIFGNNQTYYLGEKRMLLQLSVDLDNGERIVVVSNASTWTMNDGGFLYDDIYNGETYDARQATPGWNTPSFTPNSAWTMPTVYEAPTRQLSSQVQAPIAVTMSIQPVNVSTPISEPEPEYVVDFGQNFSGWAKLNVTGKAGTTVCMHYSELIWENGTVNTINLRSAKATDCYTLAGLPEGEIYEPTFTYHGFRYVQVTGLPYPIEMSTLTGQFVHSDLDTIGTFSSSIDMINRVQRNIWWGQQCNHMGIPTDCDQRDERQGWMADAHLAAETGIYNFDMAAFFTQWLLSIQDTQDLSTGSVTDTTPHEYGSRPSDPAWGAAYPLIVSYMYKYYGDMRVVQTHYESLKAFVESYEALTDDNGLLQFSYYGDWCPPSLSQNLQCWSDGEQTSGFYQWTYADVMVTLAGALGREADVKKYSQMRTKVAALYNAQFWNATMNYYNDGTQTSQVLPLWAGIVAPENEASVINYLVNSVVEVNDMHLDTGIIGSKYLPLALTKAGYGSVALEIAAQTTFPSWGHMVNMGATTLWELWSGGYDQGMNSHNHVMYSSIGTWYYGAMAGITPASPGYTMVQIAPLFTPALTQVNAETFTSQGLVASNWEWLSNGTILMNAVIPTNTFGTIVLPDPGPNVIVLESGSLLWKADKFVGQTIPGVISAQLSSPEGPASLEIVVGGGDYNFAYIPLD